MRVTMVEEQPWQTMLRDALAVLALLATEQVRVTGPGCLACDLLNDFDNARRVAFANAPQLSDQQRALLDQIDVVTEAMGQADVERFNNDVVHRQAWQQLRLLATEALSAFGWGETDVVPFVEIQPGIWHRPLSGS